MLIRIFLLLANAFQPPSGGHGRGKNTEDAGTLAVTMASWQKLKGLSQQEKKFELIWLLPSQSNYA